MSSASSYMTRQDAAAYLSARLGRRVTASSLGRHASDGSGPRYFLLLNRASYLREDLDLWIETLVQAPAPRQRRKCRKSLTHTAGDDEGKAAPEAA